MCSVCVLRFASANICVFIYASKCLQLSCRRSSLQQKGLRFKSLNLTLRYIQIFKNIFCLIVIKQCCTNVTYTMFAELRKGKVHMWFSKGNSKTPLCACFSCNCECAELLLSWHGSQWRIFKTVGSSNIQLCFVYLYCV